MAAQFSLFTSLRYDKSLKQVSAHNLEHAGWNAKVESPFYMLDFHRDRMLRAATHWQWDQAVQVLSGDQALTLLATSLQGHIGSSQSTPLRLRIVVSLGGDITFEKFNTAPVSLGNLFPVQLPPPASVPSPNQPQLYPRWTIVLDDIRTARSEYTHFKTTKRAMYDSARARLNIAPTDEKEVLLINQDDGTLMEGSMTTPYLWRGGRWVTPPVAGQFSFDDGSGGQDGTTRRWALERGIAVEEAILANSVTHGEECWISNGVRGFIAGVVSLK